MSVEHLLTRITADVANIRRAADGNHGLAGEPTDLMAALSWLSWRMGVMLAAADRIGSHDCKQQLTSHRECPACGSLNVEPLSAAALDIDGEWTSEQAREYRQQLARR